MKEETVCESPEAEVSDMVTGDRCESLIRDCIVLDTVSHRVHERLVREDNLNMANATKICQTAETTQRQFSLMLQKHIQHNKLPLGTSRQKDVCNTITNNYNNINSETMLHTEMSSL